MVSPLQNLNTVATFLNKAYLDIHNRMLPTVRASLALPVGFAPGTSPATALTGLHQKFPWVLAYPIPNPSGSASNAVLVLLSKGIPNVPLPGMGSVKCCRSAHSSAGLSIMNLPGLSSGHSSPRSPAPAVPARMPCSGILRPPSLPCPRIRCTHC